MKKALIFLITICLSFFFTLKTHADEEDISGGCIGDTDHIIETEVMDYPSCEEDGKELVWCSKECGLEYVRAIPALGHDYQPHISKEATCLESGIMTYQCSRCESSYDVEITALGHNYVKSTLKKVSCEENGILQYTCSRCNDKYQETIKALGHKYKETENIPATCTSNGHITKVCQNCKEEIKEDLKALGHDVEFTVSKKETCIENGIKTGTCKNCQETINEEIPAKGHIYPYDWTIVKDASIFSEGLKTKKCINCDNTISETIPKLPVSPALIITGGGASVGAAVLIFLKASSKAAAKKVVENISEDVIKNTIKETAKKTSLKPLFEKKAIATNINQESEFYKLLKIQKYLKITELEYDKIASYIEKSKPDLLLIDISSIRIDSFTKLLEKLNSEFEFNKIKILISKEQAKKYTNRFNELKDKEAILEYGLVDNNPNINLIVLLLPTMKPKLQSGESLKNIGMVADALGIKGVSKAISLYLKGKSIYSTTTKEDDLNFIDITSIVSTIASILGLDEVSEVTGFILALNTIKSNSKKKIGGNEASNIIDATKTVVNTINNNK